MAEKMEATRTAASLETVADISDLDTVRTPLSCRHSARVCKALSFLRSCPQAVVEEQKPTSSGSTLHSSPLKGNCLLVRALHPGSS